MDALLDAANVLARHGWSGRINAREVSEWVIKFDRVVWVISYGINSSWL